MNEDMKNIYDRSIEFWNNALHYTEEDFQGGVDQDSDWKEIGSASLCALLTDAVAGWDNVLDYGCGSGWADVILQRAGAGRIKGVDVAANAIASARLYAKAFGADRSIDYEAVDVSWLAMQPSDTYDHAICCNVLDVIPTEVSESIIEQLARVCKPGASVIVTLNPYFTEGMRNREGTTYQDPYLYVNGILRVNNHTDDEWKAMLSKYFTIEGLDHFRWDVETADIRRFYRLRVK